MNNDRYLFPLQPFSCTQPLVEHPYYRWLVKHEDTLDTRHAKVLDHYLEELGFDPARHRLAPKDHDTLRHVEEVYHNLWMPTRTLHRLDDLMFPRDKKGERTYWLRDGKRTCLGTDQVVLSTTLVVLIEKLTLVYPLIPDQFYFEVVNGALILQYQHIIGHRRLCPINPEGLSHA